MFGFGSRSRHGFALFLGLLLTSGVDRWQPEVTVNPAVLPTTYAGAPEGAFDVDGGGAATYEIPIEAPPGVNGVAPRLALTYHSRRGNGVVGVGWALNGIEAIGRCAAARYPDGFAAPIAYDGSDRFCISGSTLIAVEGEYGMEGTVYRTASDTWTKFVSHGRCGSGPCWFSAWNKDGTSLRFGYAEHGGGRILAANRADHAVRVWSVDEWTDTRRNAVTVQYRTEAGGAYYPDGIRYAGRARVRFDYEDRPDVLRFYSGGSPSLIAKRLSNIVTLDDDGEELLSYPISYSISPSTGRSRVASISHCAADGCYEATRFTMSGQASALTTSVDFSAPAVPGALLRAFDVNGDGWTDLVGTAVTQKWLSQEELRVSVWLSAGRSGFRPAGSQTFTLTGFLSPPPRTAVIPVDFDGNGRGDLVVVRNDDAGATKIHSFRSVGERFAEASLSSVALPPGPSRFIPMDSNGDGLQEITASTTTLTSSYVLNHVLTAMQAGPDGVFTARSSSAYAEVPPDDELPMDVDGDGRTDLVGISDSQIRTYRATANGWDRDTPTAHGLNLSDPLAAHRFLGGDVNGDGNGDVIAIENKLGTTAIRSWLSTAASSGPNAPANFLAGPGAVVAGGLKAFTGATLDDDGRADLVLSVVGLDNVYKLVPLYSRGDSWETGAALTLANAVAEVIAADLDGEGNDDLLVARSGLDFASGADVVFSTVQPADLLVAVDTPSGGTITVGYKPLTDPAVYAKGSGAALPIRDIVSAMPVVSEYAVGDGSNTYRFTRSYAGARIGLNGIGSLGFASVRTTNVFDGRSTEVTYWQDWASRVVGFVREVNNYNSSGVRLSSTATAWTDVASLSLQERNIHQIVLASRKESFFAGSVEKFWTLQRYEYDAYGNAALIEASAYPSTPSRTTCGRYRNDTYSWRLGYLQYQKVASLDRCRQFLAESGEPVFGDAISACASSRTTGT